MYFSLIIAPPVEESAMCASSPYKRLPIEGLVEGATIQEWVSILPEPLSSKNNTPTTKSEGQTFFVSPTCGSNECLYFVSKSEKKSTESEFLNKSDTVQPYCLDENEPICPPDYPPSTDDILQNTYNINSINDDEPFCQSFDDDTNPFGIYPQFEEALDLRVKSKIDSDTIPLEFDEIVNAPCHNTEHNSLRKNWDLKLSQKKLNQSYDFSLNGNGRLESDIYEEQSKSLENLHLLSAFHLYQGDYCKNRCSTPVKIIEKRKILTPTRRRYNSSSPYCSPHGSNTGSPYRVRNTDKNIKVKVRDSHGAADIPLKIKDSPYKVRDSLLKVKDSPFKVKDSPLKVQDSPFKVKDSPFKVKDSPYKVKDSPFKVKDSPFRLNRSSPYKIKFKAVSSAAKSAVSTPQKGKLCLMLLKHEIIT